MPQSIGSDTSVVIPAEKKDQDGSRPIAIHTHEIVPGHPAYYEKDGLRTYGDNEDHEHEPPVSISSSAYLMYTKLTKQYLYRCPFVD